MDRIKEVERSTVNATETTGGGIFKSWGGFGGILDHLCVLISLTQNKRNLACVFQTGASFTVQRRCPPLLGFYPRTETGR